MVSYQLLEDLQEKFSCKKCGRCCSVGGNMRITPRDISRLASFIGVDPGDKSAIPVKPSMANDGTYNLTVTHPCFYMDKLTRECLVHKAKPCVCREYPFVAFGKGHCTLVDVIVCPVAYEMLKEHFGVCTEGV